VNEESKDPNAARQGAEHDKNINKSLGRRLERDVEIVNRHIADLRVEMNTSSAQSRTNHDMIKQMLSLFGDIETRLECLRVLGIRAGTFSEGEYEAMWDDIKGLRVKGESEIIESGDFLTITFVALHGTKVEMQGTKMPLRLGSSGLMIEEHLVGQKTGAKKVQFDIVYPAKFKPRPDLAGKTLSFNVDIDKVKTKKKEARYAGPGGQG